MPRLPADHADVDLAVAGEAVFEVVRWWWQAASSVRVSDCLLGAI
jgi:hypothetical protein